MIMSKNCFRICCFTNIFLQYMGGLRGIIREKYKRVMFFSNGVIGFMDAIFLVTRVPPSIFSQ